MENQEQKSPRTNKPENPINAKAPKKVPLSVFVTTVIILLAALGFAGWQLMQVDTTGQSPEASTQQEHEDGQEEDEQEGSGLTGTINLTLTYPSSGIPDDMIVCALSAKVSGKVFCAENDGEGPAESINVEPGKYLILSYVPNTNTDIASTAFHDQYIQYTPDTRLNNDIDPCEDPNLATPLLIEVKEGEVVDDVVAGDWYYPEGFINC